MLTKLLHGFIILTGLSMIGLCMHAAWPYTADDIYISMRYAKHFADGFGLAWNIGEPRVEGFSNFLMIILQALALKLSLSPIGFSKVIALCAYIANGVLLYRIARLWLTPLLSSLSAFAFCAYLGTIWWTVSGMESMLYCLFINISIYLTLQSPERQTSVALILLLAALTRPEGPVIFLALLLCRTINRAPIKIFFVVFVSLYTLYFISRWHYFGQFLPNPVYCKHVLARDPWGLIIPYTKLTIPFWFFAPLALLYDRRVCYLILPSITYGLILYGADTIIAELNRFFLPALGLLIIAAFIGLNKAIRNPLVSALIGVLICVMSVDYVAPRRIAKAAAFYQARQTLRQEVAARISPHTRPNDFVATADAGVIPYYLDVKILDSLCLNNKVFTKPPIDYNFSQYAHWLIRIKKPKFILLATLLTSNTPEPLRAHLLKHPAFEQNYKHWQDFTVKGNYRYEVYQLHPL